MSEERAPGTREQILKVATELFGSKGCANTSVREIAQRLGLTKTAVLYHFATKAEILAELAGPLLDDADAAVAAAARTPAERQPEATVAGLLDAYLGHRAVLNLVIGNMAVFAQEAAFQRYFTTMTRAADLVAGPDPGLAARVHATQAIGMLTDPIILLTDAPTDELRQAILSGVGRLLGRPIPDAPHPTTTPSPAPPRRRGRPPAMDPETLAAAHAMRAEHTVSEIATALGISRATAYRYLSAPM